MTTDLVSSLLCLVAYVGLLWVVHDESYRRGREDRLKNRQPPGPYSGT